VDDAAFVGNDVLHIINALHPVDAPMQATVASFGTAPHWVGHNLGDLQPTLSKGPDLGVIVTNEDVPDVATTFVDARAVQIGEDVVKTGYGCEDLSNMNDAPVRLRFAHTTVGAFGKKTSQDPGAANYFETPVESSDGGGASLCPGDSGGPVYRGDAVVGVNSWRDIETGNADWHTRLDDLATTAWLVSKGIDVRNAP
jgi:hypothetical protein